ncbi:MAG TPA: amino acid adenylation domain-containing protein, partial [Blastocatellia bacterium]
AFDVLLYRYSGQRDILVGTPIANRNREELEPLIGFFVNTLVMRVKVESEATFREVIRRAKESAMGGYEHQEVAFEKVVEELRPERDLSHTPIFQVMFVLQNTPGPEIDFASLKLTPIKGGSKTAKFDLTLSVDDLGCGLGATLEYSTDLFNSETISRMLDHFKTLLEAAVANPDEIISRLPLLSQAERSLLLQRQNEPRTEYGGGHRIHELFERQAERTPEAVAVICGDERLCYRDLNERANNLAHHLRRLRVGPESLVGVCLERSADLVVAIMGVLKSGGGYVPLDPAYPRERLGYMLEDAGVKVVITQLAVLDTLAGMVERTICIDSDQTLLKAEDGHNPESGVLSDHTAYVIYTSGSTGKPKGVVVTHHNVARLFQATSSWFNFSENDVWALFHSYSFDFSVWEIFGALLYGGRVVIVPHWVSRSPEALYDLLLVERVTVLNQTPSAFRQLIKFEESSGVLKGLALRLVIFGGEALDLRSLKPWFDRHGDCEPALVNMYGITETTVHVTYRRIRADDLSRAAKSVIGGAIPDLQAYVLDQYQQLIPLGVAGELCIGGAGLARGYLNRPELTAERFIPNPFSAGPGERLYRSGDLARNLACGDIEYLGRIDHQVKIRGFRIELGEIEAVLSTHPDVRDSVVVAQNEEPGESRLLAYVVTNEGGAFSTSELRGFMKEKLPDYMIPSAFIALDKLPLTAQGKIDRNALPAPGHSRREPGESFVAPRTSIEEILANVWADVLGVDRVGIDDNYFALGGDSIRSIQVRAKTREHGIDFSLQHLFQYQSVRELADHIDINPSRDANADDHEPFSLISESDLLRLPPEVEDAYPLSQLQAGMIFHSQYSNDYIAYITS